MTNHIDPERLFEMITFSVEHLMLDLEPRDAAQRSLPDLGIDSLQLLSLTSELEDEFNVSFDLSRLSETEDQAQAASLAETLTLLLSKA